MTEKKKITVYRISTAINKKNLINCFFFAKNKIYIRSK